MARAPVLSSDKAADGAPKEVVDAANKLVDEIVREAEATVARNNQKTTEERRKFQFFTSLKNRAVKWFREHFGARGRDRSQHSGDIPERVEVAKSS